MYFIPLCISCKHWGGGESCEAYPETIPHEIMTGEHDHSKHYKGDNGIQFEPIK